ncbi:MAG: hypothetical protein K2O03_02680 [Lachnospiraceae bacterium]|nr:hypothetical protein [Lachnospiraceae bacterium]
MNYNIPIDRTDVGAKKQLFGDEKTVVLAEKQSFEDEETVVSNKKQLFQKKVKKLSLSAHTTERILRLYEEIGSDNLFSRADILRITGITSSPAGDLIKKMKNKNLIESITGHGKGKYRFKI